jgi:Spi protease inhibitor/Peptidase C10 family
MKTKLFISMKEDGIIFSTKRLLFVCTFFVISFWGCKPVDEQIIEVKKIPFEVSLEEAAELASKYDLAPQKNKDSKRARIVANTEVDKKETIVDENKNPLFHVLNYAKGGFIIVSADLRTIPVLAFADKGSFETKEIPDGVKQWFDEAKEKIKIVKKDNKDADPIIVKAWKEYLKGELNIPKKKGGRVSNTNCQEWYTVGQFMCQNYSSSAGPFLSTQWGQDGYATAYLGSCPGAIFCDKYNAGCGPVTLAQIMRYYQKPNWFTYDGMPDNYSRFNCNPTNPQQWELARLMAYCGSSSGLNSHYGFMGGNDTFSWPTNIPDALDRYGYSGKGSSTWIDYQVVRNELFGGHPVILWGTSVWWGNPVYHIWVCDGIYRSEYSEYNCDTHSCNTWGVEYYYMNWGQHGDWNAWYAIGNFWMGGTNYNSNMSMIYGIRP